MESTVEEQNEAEVKANYPGCEDVRSFPEPVLTVEQWKECQRCVESGMDLNEAAQAFGVEYEAVKKKAQRGQWLTKTRIVTLAAGLAEKEAAKVKSLSPVVPTGEKRTELAPKLLAESFESHRSQTLLSLAKLAGKGIERAINANLEVENWQDAKIVADIAMKLHNVGSEGVNVNVLVGGDGGFDGPVIEIHESDTYDDEDDT